MADENNDEPIITEVPQPKTQESSGLREWWWWTWRGVLFLMALRIIGEWF